MELSGRVERRAKSKYIKNLAAVKQRIFNLVSYGTPGYFSFTNGFVRLLQAKYFIKDYLFKSRYKHIEYKQEFQQELTFVLPFAYWHFLNGTLGKTVSCKFTKELYFFSKSHEERFGTRVWKPLKENYIIPNVYHCKSVYFKKWAPVPLKEQYTNNLFVFEKPLLIVANKYNTEWGNEPINFFSLSLLDRIFNKYGSKYQIVYNRPKADYIANDESKVLDLQEAQHIKADYPYVLLAEDLFLKHRRSVNNYNHFQLMLYANCDRFLSAHGGTAALASYFGGKNIILSKKGFEHIYHEFETVFPALSGAEIFHAKQEEEVITFLETHY